VKPIDLLILAAFALAAPAGANDSTAEHAAGGLVLTRTDDIDMVSEDLFVSATDSDSAALGRLKPTDKERLIRLGMAAPDQSSGQESETYLEPAWTVRETWFWEQSFPAGRDLVVEHRYVPGTGGTVDASLAFPEFRAAPEGRAMIRDYCVEPSFLAGLDRMRRRSAATPEQRLGYILTTGGNWRSPIGDFRLVVDKGAPANLVSFCGEGVRKISPTRFEMRKRNWRPDRDLRILIVQARPEGE
jgi:hypothetical protein